MSTVIEQAGWLRDTVGVRLLDAGLLRVTGPDRREWLQGQITNDVHATEEGDAVYTLLVDIKGKILADAHVLDRGEHFDLVVARDRLDALIEHLDRFLVMEEVELEAVDGPVVTAQGPRAHELGGFPCDRLGSGGVDVIGEDLEEIATRARELGGGAVDRAAWTLARLRAGRPALDIDFDRAHYPQETGLDAIAVSFEKGCYVGQEVVCMLQNRGQLRRRLVQLFGDTEPETGAGLSADGVEVGVVTSHALDEEAGGAWALAYVKRVHAVAGNVLTFDRGLLTIRELSAGDPTTSTL